jgi:hypothetical protein
VLNKECCKRCTKKHSQAYAFYISKKKIKKVTNFEQAWKIGFIICPYPLQDAVDALKNIKTAPPKNCPYILEHLITAKEVNHV